MEGLRKRLAWPPCSSFSPPCAHCKQRASCTAPSASNARGSTWRLRPQPAVAICTRLPATAPGTHTVPSFWNTKVLQEQRRCAGCRSGCISAVQAMRFSLLFKPTPATARLLDSPCACTPAPGCLLVVLLTHAHLTPPPTLPQARAAANQSVGSFTCPVCGTKGVVVERWGSLREGGRCPACSASNRNRQLAVGATRMATQALGVAVDSLAQLRAHPLRIYNTECSGPVHEQLKNATGYYAQVGC